VDVVKTALIEAGVLGMTILEARGHSSYSNEASSSLPKIDKFS
jgi:hypothetical protein